MKGQSKNIKGEQFRGCGYISILQHFVGLFWFSDILERMLRCRQLLTLHRRIVKSGAREGIVLYIRPDET